MRNVFFVLSTMVCLLMGGQAFAQSTRLPFTAAFERMSEWDGFHNATGAANVTSGCQSGGCVRAPLIGGTTNDNYGDFYFGDHVTVRGPKVEEVWLQLYSKFDAGFIWPDRSQKIAVINLGDTTTYQRYYQTFIYVRPNGQYAVDHSDIANWSFWGLFQNVGTAVSPRPGQWDKLKMYVRLNTPGQPNGIVRLWVNDQLKIDYTNVNIRRSPTSTHGMNKLIFGSYSTNASSTTGGTGVQWWDSLVLSATDPSEVTRPNPPTDLTVQ